MQSPLELALYQIAFARKYTESLLADITPDEWFRTDPAAVTHFAWQVGHIAIAQYRLTMWRVRGPRPEDEAICPASYVKLFGKDSIPDAAASAYPPVEEIRAVFTRVHQAALAEGAQLPPDEWHSPLADPHPAFGTKLAAIQFASQHEMLHAGQIGLLRRLFGKRPVR